ncbi:MAG: histidine--tRNA ligase, partial [Saprospiraceae bacterium]|nr:histidine--tRNA ligase [Saprospiraceae bacterium]
LDEESHLYAFQQVAILRKTGIACDLYPDPAKLKKQMSYANARNVAFVAIIGETERINSVVCLKNMLSGDQKNVTVEELTNLFIK